MVTISKYRDCVVLLKKENIVPPSASETTILSDPAKAEGKKAFGKWALKNHPDKGGSLARWQETSNAVDIVIKSVTTIRPDPVLPHRSSEPLHKSSKSSGGNQYTGGSQHWDFGFDSGGWTRKDGGGWEQFFQEAFSEAYRRTSKTPKQPKSKLNNMTVVQLRNELRKRGVVKGVSAMSKKQLIERLKQEKVDPKPDPPPEPKGPTVAELREELKKLGVVKGMNLLSKEQLIARLEQEKINPKPDPPPELKGPTVAQLKEELRKLGVTKGLNGMLKADLIKLLQAKKSE